ncbi:serine/threonine-protein kinase [uncultured Pseudokineococcus sp.]|uniref:serine/threonine-protein kinase n=1 Tax=uncultured Pseudokineococcus sp. TaxID=1642928 RepID=UPI00261A5592|nr:serine/threonine-protein kinase [uncultured Pseudokineococcus sp.]
MTSLLGGFELLDVVGRGSSGRVWRARERSSGDLVAIKVLREDLAEDAEVRTRFIAEAAMLVGRDMPGVVRVRGVVEEDDRLALVSDLVDGPDLRRVLRERGPLPPSEACQFIAQIAAGVAAAHAEGLVHRDLKPENVLVAESQAGPAAMVTDFGIARLADGPTTTRASRLVGTPDYVAPEVAAGQRATGASDVYALGVIFFECLTGWRPFRGEHVAAVLQQHLQGTLVRPDGLPDDLWTLVEQTLDKEPKQRPLAGELALRATAAAQTSQGVAALPRSAAPPPAPLATTDRLPTEMAIQLPAGPGSSSARRRWGKHPARLAAAVLAATTLVAGGGSIAYSQLRDESSPVVSGGDEAAASASDVADLSSEPTVAPQEPGSDGMPTLEPVPSPSVVETHPALAVPTGEVVLPDVAIASADGPGPAGSDGEISEEAGAAAAASGDVGAGGAVFGANSPGVAGSGGDGGAEASRQDEVKQAEQARQQEQARQAEQARAQEAARQADQARAQEAARQADQARAQEAARQAEQARAQEAARQAEQARQQEAARRSTETKQKYTAPQACGSGFTISEQHALPGSVVYLLWNGSTQQNCVVTLKVSNVGVESPMTAYLKPYGGGAVVDSGNFKYYADTKARTPGCIQWGGSDGRDQFMSGPRTHCP